MNFRSSLACTSSDIARWGLRSVLKRQGGVLPGRIAMKIDPELLSNLAGLVDRSVVITGTNGKTTTSNLIADARCRQRRYRGMQPRWQQHGAGRNRCPARSPQQS